jgi:fumarate hydratase class I
MVEVKRVGLPLSAEDAAGLRVGDMALLSGRLVTGRDRVHKYLVEKHPGKGDIPFDLEGAVLYHCGPVIKKTDAGYQVLAAGPTTSMRVEMYEADVIRQYGLRGIMGKGGMGDKTLRALQEVGAVYFQTTGGAAAYLADMITEVAGVWKLEEFGPTEAMWLFEIRDFPAVVTMDSHGNSIHKEIEAVSFEKFRTLAGKI